MNSKIVTFFILVLIALPVSYAAFREMCLSKHPPEQTVKVAHPPRGFSYDVKVHDPSVKGYMLLTPYELPRWDTGQIVIMDMSGKICFQRHLNGAVYSFRQWNLKEKIYYSYIINDPKAYHIRGIKLTAGHVVILDSAMNEIRQVHLLPHGDVVLNRNQDLDLHEFIMLSEHHYITMASYEKNVHNIPGDLKPAQNIKVAATIIQEIDNDQLVWQWDGTEHPELYAMGRDRSHFGDTTMTQDYLHLNSMALDPKDSNLICSFRSADMVMKIDRHNGNIIWKLGGNQSDFALTEEQKFQRQHHVILADNNQTLMMLDNGDGVTRHTSAVKEFRLNEKRKKVTSFKSYTIVDTFCQFMGNADKFGDHYFISGGTGKFVSEVDIKSGKELFKMEMNLPSYMVFKTDSIYGLEKGVIKQ